MPIFWIKSHKKSDGIQLDYLIQLLLVISANCQAQYSNYVQGCKPGYVKNNINKSEYICTYIGTDNFVRDTDLVIGAS